MFGTIPQTVVTGQQHRPFGKLTTAFAPRQEFARRNHVIIGFQEPYLPLERLWSEKIGVDTCILRPLQRRQYAVVSHRYRFMELPPS